MATMNPAKLRPSEAVWLINSTPLHDVLNDRQLRRHRERAGFRISDDNGQSINLFKYAAWLREQLFIKQNTPVQTYEEKKNAVRNRNIALALAGRDIGDLPEVENPELKEMCTSHIARISGCLHFSNFTFNSNSAETRGLLFPIRSARYSCVIGFNS